jgi:hypothetical protein
MVLDEILPILTASRQEHLRAHADDLRRRYGQHLPRDEERAEKIRAVEQVAHLLDGERLALLAELAQLLDDEQVMGPLIREGGRDYLVPRAADVRRELGVVRRAVERTTTRYPRYHEPENLGLKAPWRNGGQR